MSLIFQDMQQFDNPINGTRIETVTEIASLFESWRDRKPFLFELHSDNGFMLTIGYAGDCASVQYSSSKGLPPYLMAVADDVVDDGGMIEFLAGGTPTPISRRFCLPIDRVESITRDFLNRGEKSGAVDWEEI